MSLRQDEILQIEKDICDNFMNISNNSINIINDTIRELENMKEEFDNKLSIAYRRTSTIVKRYNESLESMMAMLDSNLQKASTMKGLGKYLLLKEVNKESVLMDELISKFNDNKALMEQWRRATKETERIIIKKKKEKFRKEDVYVVTEF